LRTIARSTQSAIGNPHLYITASDLGARPQSGDYLHRLAFPAYRASLPRFLSGRPRAARALEKTFLLRAVVFPVAPPLLKLSKCRILPPVAHVFAVPDPPAQSLRRTYGSPFSRRFNDWVIRGCFVHAASAVLAIRCAARNNYAFTLLFLLRTCSQRGPLPFSLRRQIDNVLHRI
jgi:hypothetical protein